MISFSFYEYLFIGCRFLNKKGISMKNKKTIYNSDEFRKTVRCLTEKIREADELEFVDVEKSFQDVMKRVEREKEGFLQTSYL